MDNVVFAPVVYVLSDSAGDTGDSVVRAAAAQFYPVQVNIRRTPYILDRSDVDKAIEAVLRDKAIILFTLVVPEMRDYVIEQAMKYSIPYIDTLGPVISSLERIIGQESRHKPGLIHELNEDYFKKVEAVEFAVKYDDGRDPMGVLKADIVLVGVSRTSKTPLSMYLAYKKFKVANVPLVPELKPPNELFTIAKRKIIGLTINPDKLNQIRIERLKALGLAGDANYANVNRIVSELEYSQRIMERLGCEVLDVSSRAVEETASVIIDMMRS
ncbi:pyruvate, water dikinase regulatory protein [Paenibacillus swuensis]|uniref:pyruvate, water dikinase regulatory protein n=1 Tax=Paenibacillus swuensis TaxID=1178515 RepID=UPI000A9BBF34